MMNCPICLKENQRALFTVSTGYNKTSSLFEVIQCPACEVAYLYPFPDPGFLTSLYEAGYHTQRQNPLGAILTSLNTRQVKRQISTFVSGGRLLDLGCGRGIFLEKMKNSGYEVYGVEPSKEGYEICRKIKGIHAYRGELAECKFPDSYFDLITLWHTLEHMTQPVSVIREVKRILKPKAYVLVEVPNFRCFESQVFRKHWHQLDIPRHHYFYTLNSLTRLLQTNGFRIRRVTTESFFSLPLSPIKSYLSRLKDKDSNKPISIFLLPAALIAVVIKVFPVFNLHNCIRIYAECIKKDNCHEKELSSR